MGLLSEPEFRVGLVLGLASVAVLVTLLGLRAKLPGRHVEPGAAPVIGIAFVTASLVAAATIGPLPWDVVVGVVGVTVAVELAAAAGQRTWVRAAVATPFATFLATSDGLPNLAWYQLTVVSSVAIGGALAAATDTAWRREALGPVLLPITAAGVYVSVPDTEHAAALLGVALPLVLLAWPKPIARLGAGGAAGAVALVVWGAAYGGRGRPASLLGAVACLGLLAAIAIGPRLIPTIRSVIEDLDRRTAVFGIAVVHSVIVLLAARTAGLQSEVIAAALLVLPPLLFAIGIAAVVRPPSVVPPPPPASGMRRRRPLA